MTFSDNATWVAERGGDIVEAHTLNDPLGDWERLMFCLWATDTMLRNGGDFANAPVLYPAFQADAVRCADALGLDETRALFSLPTEALVRAYQARFDAVCAEIRAAEPVC